MAFVSTMLISCFIVLSTSDSIFHDISYIFEASEVHEETKGTDPLQRGTQRQVSLLTRRN